MSFAARAGAAVAWLDQVPQQNAALVEEPAAAAEILRMLAGSLARTRSQLRCYQPSGATNAGLRSDVMMWSRHAPSMYR